MDHAGEKISNVTVVSEAQPKQCPMEPAEAKPNAQDSFDAASSPPMQARFGRHGSSRTGVLHQPIPVMDMELGIVGWEGPYDVGMPFNFPKFAKWTWVWLLSIMTLLTPFATSILSPAINILDEEFGNTNATFGSMTVSIYLLGYCISPVFIGPLSEVYGRKWVLTAANAFFCLWQIGCALAPNIAILVVSRLFAGIGGAACLTLGGSIIGDIFRPDERGFAMGMWNLGPLLGPVVGPLLGGFLTQCIGWRWDFWIVLIPAAPVTAMIAFATKETCHKVLIHQKTVRLRQELGNDSLRSRYDETGFQGTSRVLAKSLTRPLKLMVFSPLVFFLSLYISFVFGVVYLLYTTIPSVFQDKYGFTLGETGFPYISLGLGNAVAWFLFTMYSDKIVIKLSKDNGGLFAPEMRLVMAIPFGLLLPVTLFWYGWSSYYKWHWASTIVALFPWGVGIVGVFMPISTYIVDNYPHFAALATSANVILRSIVGALLPLAGPPLYSSLGLGWGNTLLGLMCILLVPIPFVFYKYGAGLRKS